MGLLIFLVSHIINNKKTTNSNSYSFYVEIIKRSKLAHNF